MDPSDTSSVPSVRHTVNQVARPRAGLGKAVGKTLGEGQKGGEEDFRGEDSSGSRRRAGHMSSFVKFSFTVVPPKPLWHWVSMSEVHFLFSFLWHITSYPQSPFAFNHIVCLKSVSSPHIHSHPKSLSFYLAFGKGSPDLILLRSNMPASALPSILLTALCRTWSP